MSEQHETVAITGPYRFAASVAKYAGDKQPGDAPIETTDAVSWHEPDGTAITDPERIQLLEKALAQEVLRAGRHPSSSNPQEGETPCP